MFIKGSFTKVKNSKQFKWLWPGKWINKLWYSHTMEYHLTIKWNKIIMLVTKRVNLKKKNINIIETKLSTKKIHAI